MSRTWCDKCLRTWCDKCHVYHDDLRPDGPLETCDYYIMPDANGARMSNDDLVERLTQASSLDPTSRLCALLGDAATAIIRLRIELQSEQQHSMMAVSQNSALRLELRDAYAEIKRLSK